MEWNKFLVFIGIEEYKSIWSEIAYDIDAFDALSEEWL